jgi:serine/threonine protein kinase
MDLSKISEGKYKFKDNKINGGAFSKIYDIDKINIKNIQKKNNKNKEYIIKLHKYKYKLEAINEINTLLKLKKNKNKFKESLKQYISDTNSLLFKSKIIKIQDYYITDDYIITVFKKYQLTLEEFNIKYNKKYNETFPVTLIKKLFNCLFVGLYELHFSKLIHCDIKPNNIMINILKYKSLDDLFKNIDNNKLKKDDIYKFIDIKIIDFNKTQSFKSIHKSVNIQTLYYTPPEIVLGNRNFNASIDVWAMMNIIYEISTGFFLFDVFNENDANGFHFEKLKCSKNSNVNSNDNSDSDSDSNSSNSSYSSDDYSENSSDNYSYEDETMSNLALLYIYNTKIGYNNFIEGIYVDKYYSYGKLIGEMCLNNKIDKIIINHNDNNLVNHLRILFDLIYIYDFNNRINTEEIIRKYLF